LAFLILVSAPSALLPQTASAADNTELARQHYKKASQLYDVGRFDEALAEYEKAYSLREDPSLLFNMAQTCRRKGDLKRAHDLYKNYLIKDPESPMRAEVESRIKALKAQIEQSEKPAAEVAPVVPIPASPSQALEPPTPGPAPGPTPPSVVGAPQAPIAVPTLPVPSAPGQADTAAPLAPGAPIPPVAAPGTYPPAQPQAAPGALPMATPGYYQAPPAPPPPPAPFVPGPSATSQAPMPVAQQTAPVPAPPKETGSSGWPLIITGTVVTMGGLVCLGLGVYNAVQTKLLSDKVTSAKTFSPSNDEQGKRAYKLQWIEGGIGIGAIVLGSTLYTIGSIQRSSRQSKVAVVPVVQPDGAMLAATGAF
jgi:hypothetical protein